MNVSNTDVEEYLEIHWKILTDVDVNLVIKM
jgi:hypothetical protein